jgi:hypothetical protein
MRISHFFGDAVFGLITFSWLGVILFFIFRTPVSRFTYLIMILGIFIFGAFSTTSYIFIKNHISSGVWLILAAITAMITIDQYNYEFIKNKELHNVLISTIFISLFLVALIKMWDSLNLES